MTTRDSFTFDDTKIQSLDSDEQVIFLACSLSILLKESCFISMDFKLRKGPCKVRNRKDFQMSFFNFQSNQNHLEQLLLKYLAASSPKPNQATRRLIARCFIVIYSKGDQRTLFDTVVSIQSMFLNRKIDDVAIKLYEHRFCTNQTLARAGIHCLGALMEEHGSKVCILFSLFLKLFSFCIGHVLIC